MNISFFPIVFQKSKPAMLLKLLPFNCSRDICIRVLCILHVESVVLDSFIFVVDLAFILKLGSLIIFIFIFIVIICWNIKMIIFQVSYISFIFHRFFIHGWFSPIIFCYINQSLCLHLFLFKKEFLSGNFRISLARKLFPLCIRSKQTCLHVITSVFNLWSLLNNALVILLACLIDNTFVVDCTSLHLDITPCFRVCLHWYIIQTELVSWVWFIVHWLWIFNCS